MDETNPLVVTAKEFAAKVDWPQASLGGAVGFASGFAAKRVAMATVKAGLLLFLVAQLPTALHHIGQDQWADWISEREKKVERELTSWFASFGQAAPRDLGRQADEAILEIRPFVKKHASPTWQPGNSSTPPFGESATCAANCSVASVWPMPLSLQHQGGCSTASLTRRNVR